MPKDIGELKDFLFKKIKKKSSLFSVKINYKKQNTKG